MHEPGTDVPSRVGPEADWHILMAEDDTITRTVIESNLKRWGYKLTVVTNGIEAWDALSKADGPRLAVLDWNMPGLDGIEVCRRVRVEPRAESVYLILLTARERKDELVQALDAGADEYLTKPFDAGELRARVSAGIRQLQMRDRLEQLESELEAAKRRIRELERPGTARTSREH